MKKTKIYLDTTVINFLFAEDSPEYMKKTKEFFSEYVKPKIYDVYASEVVIKEIYKTSNIEKQKKLLNVIPEYDLMFLESNDEAKRLGDIYLFENIIPANKIEDAEHIGLATVSEMDILLSWNFQHLANYNRKRKVKVVNERENYNYPLDIITPLEILL